MLGVIPTTEGRGSCVLSDQLLAHRPYFRANLKSFLPTAHHRHSLPLHVQFVEYADDIVIIILVAMGDDDERLQDSFASTGPRHLILVLVGSSHPR